MFSKIPEFYKDRKVFYIPLEKIKRSVPQYKKKFLILKEEILKNGMLNPLILYDDKNFICSTGNQRLGVLQSLEIDLVPVIFLFPLPRKIKKIEKILEISPENKNFISGKERAKRKKEKK